MKNSANTKFLTITTVTILTFAALIASIPLSNAQQPTRKPTYPFIGAIPNPVGVGQEVLLHVGITDPTPSVEIGWEGLEVSVERPDGSETALGPFTTDATGGTGTLFVPQMVGTYKLQTHFPEQVMPEPGTRWLEAGTVMEESSSDVLELVVQEDPLSDYPAAPLPEEYWTRPINAQHRDWYRIAGNWLSIPLNRVAPYNEYAPETPHILWAKPLETGGLAGGITGEHGFEDGDAYEGKFQESVIINGILYYNRFGSGFANLPPQQGIVAVDLRTGEELWFRNNTRLSFGQTFYFDSFNYHGVFPYLWETQRGTWKAYDTQTGEWVYTMTDVPATRNPISGGFGANTLFGPNGEIFAYVVDTENNRMTFWNSTKVVMHDITGSDAGSWGRIVWGRTFDAMDGIEWNVTIPSNLPGGINVVLEDRVIGSDVPEWTGLADDPITFWGLSTKPGEEGDLLFKETWQPPPGRLTMLWGTASLEDGVFVITSKEERALYGFDIDTGEYIWGPTEKQPYLDIYTLGETRAIPRAISIANGKLYSVGMGGVLYCYNVRNGQLQWTYEATDPYNEINWGNNWPMRISFVSDGKIYLFHDVHSPIDPKPRGAPHVVLDAETGEEMYRIDGAFRTTEWGGSPIIGDSIIALYNSYDQRIYAVGKGPSQTTVTIKDDVVTKGSNVMIKGTVMDVSAGTEYPDLKARFPDGVPCVADEDMSAWMRYIYTQFPLPHEGVDGVSVDLDVIGPDGQITRIATVTSDTSGFFKKSWTPPVEGEYNIIAHFKGSRSYWPSSAETAISVDHAPNPAQDGDGASTDYTLMFAGIIAAVILVAILVLYTLYTVKQKK